jgi:hypothetical protein
MVARVSPNGLIRLFGRLKEEQHFMKIDVFVSAPSRTWQGRIVERLRDAGHSVAVIPSERPTPVQPTIGGALALERAVLRRPLALLASTTIDTASPRAGADLTLDLSGERRGRMSIAFDGSADDRTLFAALAQGRLPELEIVLDGKSFDSALPMVDNRAFIATAAEDVLARAVTLTVRAVARYAAGERDGVPLQPAPSAPSFLAAYLGSSLPRLGREIARRSRYRFAHWRVGYRLIDGPGIAETDDIGSAWQVLPDDGSHFYADPFAFEHEGKAWIFVEDYAHATGKAVISVSGLDADGIAQTPVPVLEAPHHLSYPQVFRSGADIFMLPEGSGSGKLTLYRAAHFPDRWEPVADLLSGEISDATLLARDDGFWLFATDRDGGGSTSDTLVVFHAPALTGPWTPHRQNPILIDRRRARPGGAIIERHGRLLLPVQDGTLGYGGGLGLSEVEQLDADAVRLSTPHPINPAGDFPYPQIHTLNRAGRLEVIDGIAAVRKAHALSKAS